MNSGLKYLRILSRDTGKIYRNAYLGSTVYPLSGTHGVGDQRDPPPRQKKSNPAPDSSTPLPNAGATGRMCPPPHKNLLKSAVSGK